MYVIENVVANNNAALISEAESVSGRIDGMYIKSGKWQEYYVRFHYEYQGDRYFGENRVTEEYYRRLEREKPELSVYVHPQDADSGTLDGPGVVRQGELVFFILHVVFAAVGIGFALAAFVLRILKR